MVGVASASVRGSDDVHAGPCTPIPYLEFRARREVLYRATLAQQGHDFGGSLHVDHAVVTNQKRRILTKRLVIEKYSRRRVQVVGLAIVDGDEVAVNLRHAVG